MSLIVFLNLRCSVTDATVSGKRFQLLPTLHTKLFRLLRVPPVWWNCLINDLLSPGLLENLNNWVTSRTIWFLSILWVRTKLFFSLLFSRGSRVRAWSFFFHTWGLQDPSPTLLLPFAFYFVRYGQFARTTSSRCRRSKALYRGTKVSFADM